MDSVISADFCTASKAAAACSAQLVIFRADLFYSFLAGSQSHLLVYFRSFISAAAFYKSDLFFYFGKIVKRIDYYLLSALYSTCLLYTSRCV